LLFGPRHLTNVNGVLFFSAFTVADGNELSKSDGTEAGTVMVKNLLPGTEQNENLETVGRSGIDLYQTNNLANVNGTLFFSGGSKRTVALASVVIQVVGVLLRTV